MLWQNIYAFIFASVIMLGWVEVVRIFSRSFKLEYWKRRKMLHICTGPLFILTWPLFTNDRTGGIFAALVPFIMTVKFIMVGLGFINDPDAVMSASRHGDKKELLKGPMLYGLVFVTSTWLFWKRVRGVIAFFMLCFGDGFAEIIGRRYGSGNRLFWSVDKSFAGFLGFLLASTFSSLLFLCVFYPGVITVDGYTFSRDGINAAVRRVFIVSLVSAVVETLPLKDVDNVTIFIAAIATDFVIT